MIKCIDCGLLIEELNGTYKCFKYSRELHQKDVSTDKECFYFCRPRYEDGESIPPIQLLLLKESELKGKKMQGPV